MILQKKFSDGYEVNTYLGDEFHRVDKESCPEKFNECAKECFGENIKDYIDKVHTFIFHRRGGGKSIPLYIGHDNYILNDWGDLFKNLSYV